MTAISSPEPIAPDPAATDLALLGAQLDEARSVAAAAQASRFQLGAFLRVAVHDIRSPLASTIGFAELLLSARDLDDSVRTECLESILRAGRELERIATDLLDFGRLETGALNPQRRMLDLRKLLADCLDDVQTRAAGKSANIDAQIDDSVPDRIEADAGRLSQVISILFDRAIATTDSIRMTADFHVAERTLHLRLADPGPRPPQDVLERIFPQPGQRPDPSGLRPGEPAFRLYLARGITQAIGGTFELHEPGQGQPGSVFLVTLDLGAAAQPSA